MTTAINWPYFPKGIQIGQKRLRICMRFTENAKKAVSETLSKCRKCARSEALCPPSCFARLCIGSNLPPGPFTRFCSAKAEVECCEVLLQVLHNIFGYRFLKLKSKGAQIRSLTRINALSDHCRRPLARPLAWCAITFFVITCWKALNSGTIDPISWPLWAKNIPSPKRGAK